MHETGWEKVEALFEEARNLAPEKRKAFLEETCGADTALRREVESLLEAHEEAPNFFVSLAESVLPSVVYGPEKDEAAVDPLNLTGRQVTHYQILEPLGGGGMGIVYRAHDVKLDRPVALKFLLPHSHASEEAKRRFIREAKAASALDHSNIATVHEIDETEDGQLFIAMAYYEGETLKQKIARGPLEAEEAVDYAVQMAEGLQRAHQAGIVHRDIKPANVLVTQEGTVKLVDFGLAKAAAQTQLTTAGATLGTVAYMSPEQVQGRAVDARSDLWALGVVLYEMLTGERPFRGEHEQAIVYSIRNDPPVPIGDRRDDIPPALQAIVDRCLQKAPADRYPTAAEVKADLQQVMRTSTGESLRPSGYTTPPRRPAWTRRIAGGLAGIVVVLLVLWAFPPTREALIVDPGLSTEDVPLGPDPQADQGMVVLPCVNGGRDRANQVLCTGLMATLMDQLVQLQGPLKVWVVPAEEIRRRRATEPIEAQQWYNADWVLSGTVQRDDERMRADLTLSDGSRRPVDTVTLDVPTANLTALPNDAIARVARLLGVTLPLQRLKAQVTSGTVVPRAYEAYLQGQGHLWTYKSTEHLDAAIASFQRAIEDDPAYDLAYAELGRSYWRKYEASQDTQWVATAVQYVERALDLNDQLDSAHEMLGLIYQRAGQYEKAVRAFQQALAFNPNRAETYRHLAQTYEAQGNLEKAESTFQRVVYRWPEYWVGYNDLGLFYARHGRLEAATAQFRQALEITPEHYRAYNNLATLYQHMGRWEEALEMHERLVDIKPNHATYSNLGTMYLQEARYADAARMYEKALALKDDNYRLWGNLAAAYDWVGLRDSAQTHYQRAAQLVEEQLKTDPRNPELLCDLGGYYAQIGKKDTALSLTEQALVLAPDDVEVAFGAAETYEQLGQRAKALTWIEKALEGGYPLAQIERAPGLRQLRTDPQFRSMIKGQSDHL